jgi:pimeloyl-ACP methyl ester carboxylesterase
MAVVNVIVIHGIGELRGRGSSYSWQLQENIRKHFGVDDPDALDFWEVDWSEIGDALEQQLIEEKQVIPHNIMPAPWLPLRHGLGELLDKAFGASVEFRRFLLTGVGDVLIYRTPRGEDEIQRRLISKILDVRTQLGATDPARPRYVSIIAHSLGSVVAYDVAAQLDSRYRDLVTGLGLSHFFTMGSPLALFSLLAYRNPDETHYSERGVHLDRPDRSGEWLNFYDQQDVASFLLEKVYPPRPEINGRHYTIQDIRVQTGTFHAHTHYWANDDVAREIAQRLRDDYEKDKGVG